MRVASYVYLGQNEDDSLGDSILDSSEKLLQREVEKVSLYMISVKAGSTCNQAPIFCRKFLLVLWGPLLVIRSSCHREGLYCCSRHEQITRIGLIRLVPENIYLPEDLFCQFSSGKWSSSVVSDPQRPHRLQPTRLLCPWDFPGKSTGVGCHCLLRPLA